MKNIYKTISATLLIISLIAGNKLSAQITLNNDTVIMGHSYANEVYYSMKNGNVSSYSRNTWDIAFRTKIMSSSIITNDGTGVTLWSYPKSDTSGWSTLDTTGLYSWTPMYNDPKDWENGAFGRNAKGHPDYGWGKYNSQTHDVVGDSLFIIQLRDGSFRKLEISRKNSVNNLYYFRVANLDGSGQQDLSVNCNDYVTKDFVGFSLETNEVVDYQPARADWDILFTKYMSVQPNGQPYPVTGVLNNDGVFSKNHHPVSPDYVDFVSGDWDSTRSSIGWNWKFLDTNYMYHILDSNVYFVKSLSGDVYKLVFKKFAGSSTGLIAFQSGKIAGMGVQDKPSPVSLKVFPNPATDRVTISLPEGASEMELTDITGKRLIQRTLSSNANSIQLDVTGLVNGIYFIRINSQLSIVCKKLMITR